MAWEDGLCFDQRAATGYCDVGVGLTLLDLVCFPGPGLAPAGDLRFFASPKKRRQKKGDPTFCVPALRSGQPAVLAVRGVPPKLASLRQGRALIREPLRSSAQPEGIGKPNAPSLRSARGGCRRCAPAAAWGPSEAKAREGSPPLWLRRGAERFADQGSPLFERSEFGRDPAKREHRRLPVAKRRDADSRVAFLLPTFLWRSKEK